MGDCDKGVRDVRGACTECDENVDSNEIWHEARTSTTNEIIYMALPMF